MYKIAEFGDLEKVVNFLLRPEIDNSFILPLSKRPGVNVANRVYGKHREGRWIIAYDNTEEHVVGCCAVVKKGNDVELSTYVVDEAYRGLGIGSTLFDMALKIAKDYPKDCRIMFDSWAGSGIASIAIKRGFVKTREFYGDPKRPTGIATVEYEYRGER